MPPSFRLVRPWDDDAPRRSELERLPLVGWVASRLRNHVSDEDHLRPERVDYLQDAIATLPASSRLVVEAWFIRIRPTNEIASELGVSEARVLQMRTEAMMMLGDALNRHLTSADEAARQ